jgi:2'-5' RNA ligase
MAAMGIGSKTRFFIALVPPDDINQAVLQIIDDLSQRYRTNVAKAPPHITLQPPFLWPEAQISQLQTCLNAVAHRRSPVPITQSDFGAFAPRVLFINVAKTPALVELQAELMTTLEQDLGIVDTPSKTRGFAPHLTVASRNLSKATFQQVWAELALKSVSFEWLGDRLILFRHDGQRWQTASTYALQVKAT